MNTEKMSVAERNAWFAELSPKEQRIQLARDVLAQLETERIKASPGVYVDFPLTERLKDLEVQAALIENQAPCNVCAKGALFVARVAGYNSFRKGDTLGEVAQWDGEELDVLIDDEHTLESLEGIFTREQLDLIENAFEGRMLNYSMDMSDGDPWSVAAHMYEWYSGTEGALEAIMLNILKNDGVFLVPSYEECCRQNALTEVEK
jgi:hypothetical protein